MHAGLNDQRIEPTNGGSTVVAGANLSPVFIAKSEWGHKDSDLHTADAPSCCYCSMCTKSARWISRVATADADD